MPAFAEELRARLASSEKPQLAHQVDELELLSRCACGDSFCSTFHTGSGTIVCTLPLELGKGILSVDLDEADRIQCVEVLFRPDVEQELSLALRAHEFGAPGQGAG